MTHEELNDQYELLALGAADEAEGAEIREHLARGCEVCMRRMNEARELVALIGGSTVAAAEPPRRLRRRILASVGAEERRFSWIPVLGLATALSLFGAFYFSTREREFAAQTVALREQMGHQSVELTRLNEAFAILSGPATIEVGFGQGPKGKVYVDRTRGVLLVASNLPPAPAGKIYEMWTIPKGGKPVPAGIFNSEAGGAAIHVQPGAVDANLAMVAVTLENEGGASTPTLPPVFGAAIPE